jgi:hypothetical protein
MSKKKQKYSARDFRVPLLDALGTLTNRVAFVPVDCKETYPLICARMEISADDFDKQEASGKLWVHQWIGWAFRALKKSGDTTAMDSLGVKFRRGYWALTPLGIDNIGGAPIPDATPAPKQLPAPVPDPTPVAGDPYSDGYLRKLAIEQTSCYGSFSRTAPACEKCLLRPPCSKHFLAKLSALSAEVNKRILRLKTRPVGRGEKPTTPATPATSSPPAPSKIAGGRSRRRTARAALATRCNRCGDTIPKDDQMVWIQTSGRGDGGTFHPDCAPDEDED